MSIYNNALKKVGYECVLASPGLSFFLGYVLRTSIISINKMKDNGIKERSRRYPEQIITDADYADDIALLSNTTAQA